MTKFLASVRNRQEAEIALKAGADIIDLKEPSNGALGAVDVPTVLEVVRAIGGRCPVSATVGDMPMPDKQLSQRVKALAEAGIDYVKIGLDGCDRLAGLPQERAPTQFIVVLFADRAPSFDPVAIKQAGFCGVMVDTATKGAGSLLDHWDLDALGDFAGAAKAHGLLAGFAGSLRPGQVAALLKLEPDVLGFRGALCRGGSRTQALDPAACRSLRGLIAQEQKARFHATSAPAEPVC